jgi:hypothetical protein
MADVTGSRSPVPAKAGAPGDAPPGQEEFSRQVRDRIRARRSETIDMLGPEPVLWLAIPPLWSGYAAKGAGFPAASLSGFIAAAGKKDYCKHGRLTSGEEPDGCFWMPGELRPEVTGILAGRPGTDVTRTAREIASRVAALPAPGDGVPSGEMPGALAAWARLACRDNPYAALARQVPQAVSAGDPGAVQDLLAAAESLPAVFGPGGENEAALLSRALRARRPAAGPGRRSAARHAPPGSRARCGGQRA